MEFLMVMALLYFLPTIVAIALLEDAVGIFLVNFFFGWTVIGWWVALVWALASHKTLEVREVPASSGRFCSHCGKLSPYGARYCSGCGWAV